MNRRMIVVLASLAVVAVAALAFATLAGPYAIGPVSSAARGDQAIWCRACQQWERAVDSTWSDPLRTCTETLRYVDVNSSGTLDAGDSIAHTFYSCSSMRRDVRDVQLRKYRF